MYPIEKYRFYTNGKTVVAVSTYAGKTVRGVASCDPKDEFDINKGKELAAARCAVKIAQKRLNRATFKAAEAELQYKDAEKHLNRMSDYLDDAMFELGEAEDRLIDLNSRY